MKSTRRALKSSETKILLQDFLQKFPQSSIEIQAKGIIEEVPVENGKVFLMADKPFAISARDQIFPSLMNEEVLRTLPSIVVDMGAIPHICNGADVMRPGIREIRGEFEEGAVVLVQDVKFGKPIAICVASVSSGAMRAMSKGKAAQTVHYVGDLFWDASRKP